MSDTTTSGSAGQGAGTGTETTTTTTAGSGQGTPPVSTATQTADWRTHIPEEFKTAQFWGNVKDTSDLVKQFAHMQGLVGADKVIVPKDNWTDAEWQSFYTRTGRPESPGAYKPVVNDKNEPVLPKEMHDGLAEIAHKYGLHPRQFAGVCQALAEGMAKDDAADTQSHTETLGRFRDAFVKQHGENAHIVVDKANKALAALGDEELTGLMQADPMLANHPSVLNLLSKVADFLGEDALRTTGVSPSAHSSPAAAVSALKNFEVEHASLLNHKNPEMLPFSEKEKRAKLIEERGRLFRSAYPN